MQKSLFIKVAIIAGLCMVFGIGLTMILSLVYERQDYSESVKQELTEQHVKPQHVITPFIVLTKNTETCDINSDVNDNDQQILDKNTQTSCKTSQNELHALLPTQTQANNNLSVDDKTYKRSIYSNTSYQGTVTFQQKYHVSDQGLSKHFTDTVTKKQGNKNTNKLQTTTQTAHLLIPISDLRGVTDMPTVSINGKKLTAQYPDQVLIKTTSYLEVVIPDGLSAKELTVDISLPLSGMSKIQTMPLGDLFKLSMQADWHSPNFVGQALPNSKELGSSSFTASWQNQHLTVKNNQLLSECIRSSGTKCSIKTVTQMDNHYKGIRDYNSSNNGAYQDSYKDGDGKSYQQISFNSFDVEFAKPNDVYLQTERSIKYALLLIAVSFASFFLFEVIKSLRIHPVQYFLVGMALLVFYVLLLSLAEQIAFWQAYAIAATACAVLIGWYTYYFLHSVVRAGIFTLILAGQYAGFFVILTIQELNLLIGAILCFVMIASVMFITRKIDWYQVT